MLNPTNSSLYSTDSSIAYSNRNLHNNLFFYFRNNKSRICEIKN